MKSHSCDELLDLWCCNSLSKYKQLFSKPPFFGPLPCYSWKLFLTQGTCSLKLRLKRGVHGFQLGVVRFLASSHQWRRYLHAVLRVIDVRALAGAFANDAVHTTTDLLHARAHFVAWFSAGVFSETSKRHIVLQICAHWERLTSTTIRLKHVVFDIFFVIDCFR